MSNTYFKAGDYNVICDRCGFKVKASKTKKEWNGLRVCSSHWEARHPQDKIRGQRDVQRVPDPRPATDPVFVSNGEVTIDDL